MYDIDKLKEFVNEEWDYYFRMVFQGVILYENPVDISNVECRVRPLGNEIHYRIPSRSFTTCRESVTYYYSDIFRGARGEGKEYGLPEFVRDNISQKGQQNYLAPDFYKGNTNLVMLNSSYYIDKDSSDIMMMFLKNIACRLFPIFKEKSFEVSLKRQIEKNESSVYGEYCRQEVFNIKFPNVYVSSPAIISMWTSLVKNSLLLSKKLVSLKSHERNEILNTLEKIDTHEDALLIASKMIGGPYEPFVVVEHGSARNRFPINFFRFNLKRLEEGKFSLFDPSTWLINANGYLSTSKVIYDGIFSDLFKPEEWE